MWLFAKTTYLAKEGLAKLTVLLTPSFDGKVWDEKDEKNLKIKIYGTSASEVSYRLTAPRFDWRELPNTSDAEHEGFKLDYLLRKSAGRF